jgi:23S rRNA (adenine-N6)-dimethyltransferase
VAGRRRHGVQPPGRSQHFLSRSLAEQLVRQAGIGAEELVVDIGAGNGRLTEQLARVAKHVIAVEVDARYARQLRGRWDNVEVNEADVVGMALPGDRFRVVANLPFSRTNDILRLLLDDPRTPLSRADLVVEWGVACKRGLPWPSSASGVMWGATYETSVVQRLPRAVFEPPPTVDAGILSFRRRNDPLVPSNRALEYSRFVTGGFRHGLGRVTDLRTLTALGHRGAFARDLDAHAWAHLFKATDLRAR